MAKANAILFNSILWNLREVTQLTEKVKKHCGDVDCISWRYPLTSCSDLEVFKLLQNNRNLDKYTYILELTYDRLLYLFNLIIKYLESTEQLKKFRPNKNVYRPKTLSLAAVLHMIWDRIQAQTESIQKTTSDSEIKGEVEESEKGLCVVDSRSKSSIHTQSEVSSISACSCCEMVQQFVTQLVLEMEKLLAKQDFYSAISAERKIMRESLADMTNWTAMSRWLSAIIKDLSTLMERVDQATTSSRRLKSRLESREKKLRYRAEQQEEESKKLQTLFKEQELKVLDLKKNLEKLTQDRNSLVEQLKEKNSELDAQSSEFQKKITDMTKSHEIQLKESKEKNLKREKEREQELKHSLENQYKRAQVLEEQNSQLEKATSQLKENLERLNVKLVEDKKNFQSTLKDMEEEIKNLKQENINLNLIIEEKQEKIKDYSMRIMQAYPELHDVPLSKFKVSGIPEIDMETQIEANNIRIDLLQTENTKLQRTLDKIKSLKG